MAFARQAVARYSAMGVDTYQVWNEPNLYHFWAPAPDVAAYTRLLRAAYPAIKAANPNATVLAAGLAPMKDDGVNRSAVDFLAGIYAHGAAGTSTPSPPTPTPTRRVRETTPTPRSAAGTSCKAQAPACAR